MPNELNYAQILDILTRYEVEFILVGGLAAIVHGSPLPTEDVDIVYRSSEQNRPRLAEALKELKAHYFDPAGRYIEPDLARLATMRTHLLVTSSGRLDVMQAIGRDLTYDDLLERSGEFEIEDFRVYVLNLETIIETKEEADRPKDRHALLFLRQLLDEVKASKA